MGQAESCSLSSLSDCSCELRHGVTSGYAQSGIGGATHAIHDKDMLVRCISIRRPFNPMTCTISALGETKLEGSQLPSRDSIASTPSLCSYVILRRYPVRGVPLRKPNSRRATWSIVCLVTGFNTGAHD